MSLRKTLAIGMTALMVLAAIASVVGPAIAQGNEDDVLYLAMQQDTPNFNYMDLASNSVWKKYVIGAWVFEAMSLTDPQGNLFPFLAEDWTFDEDTLTAEVTLRSNVKFHDGVAMTADDVVYSYIINRAGTTYSTFVIDCFDTNGDGLCSADEVDGAIDADANGVFEGISKIDDTHVKIVLSKPYGQFFLQGLGVPVLPKHIWKDHLTTDGVIDVLWNTDPVATIGTGPFKYDSGERNVFRKLVKFEDYWGKDFVTPSGHHVYPGVVDTLYLKLYSSLDTAILALKSGQVDHIPWTVTAGYVPDLIANPNTDIMPISDNGYFYYAFNMKREPMNILPFRKAVSYCIDKRTITDRYMGGFGQPGDSAEPPFWSDWYNTSVAKYSYDVAQARSTLTAAGFTGVGTALKFPDGRAVPPLVLMTPPADYDPVRIKAGEMIAKQLRGLGIDVVAKPVDFDTLVAKMNSFDYDMLIIGWSMTSDPVGNVFDILGPKASSNYFGFWSTTNDNPWYNTLGGVSTKADAETQALADKLAIVQELAKGSFDRDLQIKYTKWGQGIVAEALPCNVLYYRLNNYAISNKWDGWVSYLGELFQVYSVAELTKGVTPPPTGAITPVLNVPDKLQTGTALAASVLVVDEAGLPVENVSITLSATGATFSASTGTTDATGMFSFTVTGTSDGYVTINAQAVKGTASVTTSRTVSVVGSYPPTLFVTASPEKIYLDAGESTTVKLKATNAAGVGVAGVELALDENLMGYGSVDKTTGTTDANGEVTITWTAPAATILNKHIESRLSVAPTATATYPASSTSTVTQFLVLKNMAPSSWHLVKVVGATKFACNATNKTTEVTVMAMDAQGNALASEPLAITYSNGAALNAPPTTVTTNATGYAVATITWADGIDTNATQVFFKNPNVPNAIGAGASLLFKGTTVPTEPMYGGYSTVNVAAFLNPDTTDELTVDIFLYDLDGMAASGDVPVALIVGEPSDGASAALVDAPDYIYTSLTDYAGINMFTSADKGSVTTGGYFLSTLMTNAEIDVLNGGTYTDWAGLIADAWTTVDVDNMKPYTVTDGHATIKIKEDNVYLADTIPSVYVAPMAKTGFYVTADYNNFWWEVHAPTAFKMDLVMQRTMTLASAKYTVSTGILKDFAPSNVANVEMWLYDQDNAPMVGESAALYGGNLFTYTTAGVTDATGKTTGTVTTKPTVTTPQRQPIYVAPDIAGRGTTFASFEMFNIPVQLYALLSVAPTVQQGPATATVTAKVMDETGTGIADLLVTFANEGGSLSSLNATTNANGEGTVTYTLPEVEAGEKKAFGEVSMQALKPGHGAAATSYTVVTYNLPPVISDLSISDTGYETYDKDVTIAGKATDVQGLAFLRAVLDSGTPVNVTVGTGGAFTHAMINLSIGAHTVVFTAEDIKGLTTTHTVAFAVKENVAPSITDLSKSDGFKTKDTAFTLTGKVSDTDGVKSAKISVDGGAQVALIVTNGSWSYDFKDLKVGKHSAVITVEDNFGKTATKTLNFEVEEEGAGGSTMLLLVIVIIIILVIIVVVMMMMKKKKPAEAPKA